MGLNTLKEQVQAQKIVKGDLRIVLSKCRGPINIRIDRYEWGMFDHAPHLGGGVFEQSHQTVVSWLERVLGHQATHVVIDGVKSMILGGWEMRVRNSIDITFTLPVWAYWHRIIAGTILYHMSFQQLLKRKWSCSVQSYGTTRVHYMVGLFLLVVAIGNGTIWFQSVCRPQGTHCS